MEARARQLAAGYGEAAALEIFSLTTDKAKRGLLGGHGFAPRRTVYRLGIDLPEGAAAAPPPPGIALRGFRAGHDDQTMHRVMTEAFADHYRQSNEPFEAWRTRQLGHPDFDAALWFLAWQGDEPVGGVIAYDFHDVGWVRGLGVRRPWRRQGVGAALLTAAFAALAHRGQRRAELGVDVEGATSPLRLYEAVGMRVVHAVELFEKPLRP